MVSGGKLWDDAAVASVQFYLAMKRMREQAVCR